MPANMKGGSVFSDFDHDIDETNTVDGKPIIHRIGQIGGSIGAGTNAGTVFCIRCEDVIIEDLTLNNNGQGVVLLLTTDSTIRGISATGNQFGIVLVKSSGNTISGNTLGDTVSLNVRGVQFIESDNNIISGNTITASDEVGMSLRGNDNRAIGNTVGASFNGIAIAGSDNFIADNDISDIIFLSINVGNTSLGVESNDNIVTRNKIAAPRAFIGVGLGGDNNTASLNEIAVRRLGIDIDSSNVGFQISTGNIVRDNKITAADIGISTGRGETIDTLILNNVINAREVGIRIRFAVGNRAERNTIKNGAGDGIVVDSSQGTVIIKNKIKNNGSNGIVLVGSDNTTVKDNKIEKNAGDGVLLTSSNSNDITKNDIKKNDGNGVVLDSSEGNTVKDNKIEDNAGDGVLLTSSDDNDIDKNDIKKNDGDGVALESSNNNTITKNKIEKCGGVGISEDVDSSGNTIKGNKLKKDCKEKKKKK